MKAVTESNPAGSSGQPATRIRPSRCHDSGPDRLPGVGAVAARLAGRFWADGPAERPPDFGPGPWVLRWGWERARMGQEAAPFIRPGSLVAKAADGPAGLLGRQAACGLRPEADGRPAGPSDADP